ncbi:MAG: hypothetical protein ACRESO_10635, partial [Gammaproteobacteria bacterium]
MQFESGDIPFECPDNAETYLFEWVLNGLGIPRYRQGIGKYAENVRKRTENAPQNARRFLRCSEFAQLRQLHCKSTWKKPLGAQ